ncbi:Saccharopine dehydrogenase-domain-containing protein [Spinellus fusiger]|nr:Saccharopine dehydrogenase-domain-containing protein [Spinellus fusiger]
MADRFHITIFGASGRVGRFSVEHVYELSTTHPAFFPSSFRWAIAGRDPQKLDQLIDTLIQKYPRSLLQKPTLIVANVVRRDTIDAMTRQTQVLLNAVGPYRYMGEYVVRSCIEQQCYYVDSAGETEFIERMQRTYHPEAVKKQVTIVHACGFDSVPADMGVLWVKQAYTARQWTPTQIESFLRIYPGESGFRLGYARYEAAVHDFSSSELLVAVRELSGLMSLPSPSGPPLKRPSYLAKDHRLGYYVPYTFSTPSIVHLSQQLFLTGHAAPPKSHKATMPPTVQFAAYLLLPSLWTCIVYYIYRFVFSLLTSSPWGRHQLLIHPERYTAGLCSQQQEQQEQRKEATFELILRSQGYDSQTVPFPTAPLNQSMTVVVRGPEPDDHTTPRILVQCALTLLKEASQQCIPYGVMTPSAAFWNTQLVDRLCSVGITYEQEQCL